MKVGLFDYLQKNGRSGVTYVELISQHLEMWRLADRGGMDFGFMAEHHCHAEFAACPSPPIFLARVLGVTKKMRIGPLGYVLPFWHPLKVAEDIVFLDNMTGGRIEFGFGNGAPPFSFPAFGVSVKEKSEQMWECYQMIRGIWANPDGYDYEGKYYSCKGAKVSMPFVQKPHPPMWLPSRNESSLKRAAFEGISTIQWVAPRLRIVRELFDVFRDACKKTNLPGPRPRLGMLREIYVGETDGKARNEARSHWRFFWERYGDRSALPDNIGIPREVRWKELRDIDASIKDLSLICGSPDSVVQQIKELTEEVGADTFLGDFAFGALTHEQVMKSMKLFIKHVLPEIRKESQHLSYRRKSA